MLMVHHGESLKSNTSEEGEMPKSMRQNDMIEEDDEGVNMDDQDEMLLTRTDGGGNDAGMSLKYGSGVPSST